MSQQRIVCAAIRGENELIMCGARHYDATMTRTIVLGGMTNIFSDAVQGFIDQRGNFLTREEAWIVAEKAGQIIRRVGGDGTKLFSENLY